jgi:hypothetical protein
MMRVKTYVTWKVITPKSNWEEKKGRQSHFILNFHSPVPYINTTILPLFPEEIRYLHNFLGLGN